MKSFALVLALIASNASALSCLPPDPTRAFQSASDAPSAYVVLLGQFDFDASGLPPAVSQGDAAQNPAPRVARFVGNGLTLQGFTSPQDRDIILEFSCAGPWCGTLQPGATVMAYARKDGDTYAVEVDPCSGWIFPQPTDETLDRVIDCLRGNSCDPAI